MTIKLIYVCDRCSETSEDGIGWSLLWPIGGSLDTESGIVAGFSKAYLCSACSKRALEKPVMPDKNLGSYFSSRGRLVI